MSATTPQIDAQLELTRAMAHLDTQGVSGALTRGANPNGFDGSGDTPLTHCARMAGNEAQVREMMSLLIQAGAHLETPNRMGRTPLMQAARAGMHATVEWLLERNAAPLAIASTGWTAAMEACNSGYTDIVLVLIEAGGWRRGMANAWNESLETLIELKPDDAQVRIKQAMNAFLAHHCAQTLDGNTPKVTQMNPRRM
jgi:ankyrin repeat protein